MKEKNCIHCGIALDEENWPKSVRKNYVYKCNSCFRAECRKYQAAWVKRNPELSIARSKKHQKKLRENDPKKYLARSIYNDSKKRAKKKNFTFDLDVSFIYGLISSSTKCPYMGIDLTFDVGSNKNTKASIDRIDSTKGYEKNNVQVISYLANVMKSNATDDELFAFASGVMRSFDKMKGTSR